MHEAQAVGEHELRLLRRNARALGIPDLRRQRERRALGAPRDPDRLLGAEVPGMVEVEVAGGACASSPGSGGPAQSSTAVLRAIAAAASTALASAAGGKIRGAGVAAARVRALAEIHRDADALVAVVLDRFGLVLAHRHRQPVALGDLALAGRGAGAPRRVEHRLRELPQLRRRIGEAPAAGRMRDLTDMARYHSKRWKPKSSAGRRKSSRSRNCRSWARR